MLKLRVVLRLSAPAPFAVLRKPVVLKTRASAPQARMDNVAATFAMGVDDPTPAVSVRYTFDVKWNLRLDVGLLASAEFDPPLIHLRECERCRRERRRYFPRSICLSFLRSGTPCCSSKHDSNVFRS